MAVDVKHFVLTLVIVKREMEVGPATVSVKVNVTGGRVRFLMIRSVTTLVKVVGVNSVVL